MTALDHLAWRDGPPDLPAEGETLWVLERPERWLTLGTLACHPHAGWGLETDTRTAWWDGEPWPAGWRCAPFPDGAEEARLQERLASARESYDLALRHLPPTARDALRGFFVGVWGDQSAPAKGRTGPALKASHDALMELLDEDTAELDADAYNRELRYCRDTVREVRGKAPLCDCAQEDESPATGLEHAFIAEAKRMWEEEYAARLAAEAHTTAAEHLLLAAASALALIAAADAEGMQMRSAEDAGRVAAAIEAFLGDGEEYGVAHGFAALVDVLARAPEAPDAPR